MTGVRQRAFFKLDLRRQAARLAEKDGTKDDLWSSVAADEGFTSSQGVRPSPVHRKRHLFAFFFP